ncbi:MAG: DUF4956 domain-containing protein [Candidatus Cloacimonetes bacterium]|nr:DUF4956 domain-containing protein [Candidatus Cloacimonadota bacterium]
MTQTFQDFVSASGANIPLFGFTINLILSAILAIVLSWIYTKYGNSLSNRKQFGKNFLLITMTTMLIISVVKSSLALSLGLVGALSIIRFRAAIKEPEELAYLFMAIAIGLGFGADQTGITLLAFAIVALIVIFTKKFSKKFHENQNLYLTIHCTDTQTISIDIILEILKKYCDAVDLRRFDETNEMLEVSFLVEAQNFEQLSKTKTELQKLNKELKITFLDNKGLL